MAGYLADDFRNQLLEFFQDNDPSQLEIVDSYVMRFQGREELLNKVDISY
jgi:hypothetical protein